MQDPDEIPWMPWKPPYMDIFAYEQEVSIRKFKGDVEPSRWSKSEKPGSAWQHLIETHTGPDGDIADCFVDLTGLSVVDGLPTAVLCKLYTFVAVCSEIEDFQPMFADDSLFQEARDYQARILEILAQRSDSRSHPDAA